MPADLIPVTEAAELANKSVHAIRRWIKKQRLRAWRRPRVDPRLLFVSRGELEENINTYEPVEPTQ